jgi:lysozyme
MTLKTSAAGRAFIEAFEGLFLQAYDDADDHVVKPGERVSGTLTIGYGHTSAAGAPKVYVGMTITEAEADAILAADLAGVEVEVAHLVTVSLDQNQFDALVSFQFNTGWLGHPQCSLLKALNAGNYALTEQDFTLYDEASGKVLAGLERRRDGEKLMFEGQVYAALKLAGAKLPSAAMGASAPAAAPGPSVAPPPIVHVLAADPFAALRPLITQLEQVIGGHGPA